MSRDVSESFSTYFKMLIIYYIYVMEYLIIEVREIVFYFKL